MAAKTQTDRVTVRLPTYQIEQIENLVKAQRFRNTTDVVYNALKVFLEAQGTGAKQVIEAEWGLDELKRIADEKATAEKAAADQREALRKEILKELLGKLQ